MKPYSFWFKVAGGAALCFIVSLVFLASIKEDMQVLTQRAKEMGALTSGKNISMYINSIFDGLTLGAFAEEGIFSESKKREREIEALEAQWASLHKQYHVAGFVNGWSFIVGVGATITGFIKRSKSRTAHTSSDANVKDFVAQLKHLKR